MSIPPRHDETVTPNQIRPPSTLVPRRRRPSIRPLNRRDLPENARPHRSQIRRLRLRVVTLRRPAPCRRAVEPEQVHRLIDGNRRRQRRPIATRHSRSRVDTRARPGERLARTRDQQRLDPRIALVERRIPRRLEPRPRHPPIWSPMAESGPSVFKPRGRNCCRSFRKPSNDRPDLSRTSSCLHVAQ